MTRERHECTSIMTRERHAEVEREASEPRLKAINYFKNLQIRNWSIEPHNSSTCGERSSVGPGGVGGLNEYFRLDSSIMAKCLRLDVNR